MLEEIEQEGKRSKNTTDSECTRVKGFNGTHAGYNAQAVVDEKHGLIVNSDVVNENNDLYQFANQVNQANENLGKKCDTACADSGYADTNELEKIDNQEIKVIVPSQRQASKKTPKPFDKANFSYDPEKNHYICPEGHVLRYTHFDIRKKHKSYVISDKFICLKCRYFGKCTKSKYGRKVIRLHNEETREKLEAQYKQAESQEIYKMRKQKAEIPFGHIKRNLKVNAFLLRGLEGVRAEMSLLASCFNISRMITLFGVEGLVKELAT